MNFERLKKIYDQKGYQVLDVKPGQYVEIHERIVHGNSSRVRKFRGLILSVRKPSQPDGTFVVRGKSSGVTIEKIYPLCFQKFEKILLIDQYKIRRAKLYYIRHKIGKKAKMKSLKSVTTGVDLLKK